MTKHTSPLAWEAAGDVRPRFEVNEGDVLAVDPSAINASFAYLEDDEEEPTEFERVGDSAVVKIRGPLSQHDSWWTDSYEAIKRRCDAAFDGPDKRVILKISSPGGYVAGCFELCDYLVKRKAEAGKQLIAYVDGQATSAAYALACSADKIYSPETGVVGSVGVVLVVADMSAAYKSAGVKVHVLTSGKRKADGSPYEPLSADARAAMQKHVNDMADVFFRHVADARGMTRDEVAALDAAIMVGSVAKTDGLVDEVMTFDEIIASFDNGSTSVQQTRPMAAEVPTVDVGASASKVVETAIQAPIEGAQPGGAVASPKQERSIMDKAILQALGCAEDATEAAVFASATKLRTDAEAIRGENSQLKADVADLFACLGVSNMDAAKGAIEAHKANKVALDEARVELQAVKDAKLEAERGSLLEKAGEMYTPATMEKLNGQSIEFIRAYIEMTPAHGSAPTRQAEVAEPAVESAALTEEEKRVAKSTGLTEKEFAEEKARLRKIDGGSR